MRLFLSNNRAEQYWVQGNFLGTNTAGDEKAANQVGVFIDAGSTGNLIGGVTPEDRNLISGNSSYGVLIRNGCNSNKVQGNYIGTDVNGTSALGNGGEGIGILNASLNLIGGPEAEAPNLISGNTGDGILIHEDEEEEGYSLLNQIMHNRIGTNGPGDAPLPNGGHGVNIVKAAFTIVGGGGASARNLISGNTLDGVRISGGAAANTNQVVGNYIGTDKDGTAPQNNPTALGNRNGVVVDGAGSTFIGGSVAAGEGNVISGNKNDGVFITRGVNVFVRGNFIGTDKDGGAGRRNNGNGVYIHNSLEVRVGGTAANDDDRNIISGNGDPTPPVSPNIGNGVLIVNGTSVRILNNYIGTDKDGANDIGNQRDGVSVNQGSGVIVGGAGMNEPNRISGNKKKAVSGDPLIKNNILGKKQMGGALPNQEGGISVSGSGATVEDNEIWYNTGPGIAVVAGTGHRITGNSIAFNTGLGIDLGGDGRTINDLLDLDTGPNNLQNFPVLTSVVANGGVTTVSGTLNSTPASAFILDFYGNNSTSSLDAQGEFYLGSTTVFTDALGNAQFSNVPLTGSPGNYVTATATDSGGNTSEFSDANAVTDGSATITGRAWVDANGNGIRGAAEAFLSGVTVRLLDGSGAVVASTTTGSDGRYLFSGQLPGTYAVAFVAPTGYVFSAQNQGGDDSLDSDADPATGRTEMFLLGPGEDKTAIDAGLVPLPGSIGDRVWLDNDGDGIQDPGEPGSGGMEVRLYTAGGTLIASTITNASGLYSFTGVASGDYYLLFGPGTITFTIQDAGSDDSLDSDPNSSGQTAVFTLAPGQTRTDLDAGVAPPSGFSLSLLSSGPPSQPLDGYFTLTGAVGFLAEETSQSGATDASESDAAEPDTPSAGEAVETALFGFSPETVDLLFSSLGETSEAEEMAEVLAVSLVNGLEPVLPG